MHKPIRFHHAATPGDDGPAGDAGADVRPKHMDLKKDKALTIRWSDGRVSIYPIAYLRKLSPSAEAKELRKEMARNPLTVLPANASKSGGGPLTAEGIEMVGNYAVRLRFSDGHDTGIYSWAYLRQIDPNQPDKSGPEGPGPAADEAPDKNI
jgi:DUF971 family protein